MNGRPLSFALAIGDGLGEPSSGRQLLETIEINALLKFRHDHGCVQDFFLMQGDGKLSNILTPHD